MPNNGIIRTFFVAAFFASVFMGNAVAQVRYASDESESPGPVRVESAPAKQDPAVLKKLDDIQKAIKELKGDIAKINEELNIIKIRVTQKS